MNDWPIDYLMELRTGGGPLISATPKTAKHWGVPLESLDDIRRWDEGEFSATEVLNMHRRRMEME